MVRQRLDLALVERGLCASREQARLAVLAGQVRIDGRAAVKASSLVAGTNALSVVASPRFASRGGEKLDHALREFSVDVTALVTVDLGASTGGFTDCLLQRGAARVYSVDVGYGLLDVRLRGDPRVTVIERVNARYLTQLPEPVDLIVADLSFISLTKVLPAAAQLLRDGGELVVLVKPQFEAGRREVVKGGIVRDPLIHAAVLGRLARWLTGEGYRILGLTVSPLLGASGNREFLMHLLRPGGVSVTYQRIGLLYHPRQPVARELAESLRATALGPSRSAWLAETGDEQAMADHMAETDLLVCIGGDGTVLWAARAAAEYRTPIVSVNMGHLGFLSELDPAHAGTQLARVLNGEGRIEDRSMVECVVRSPAGDVHAPAIGLNDVVVGRAAAGRPVYLAISVDGVHLATVRADGVIAATATGSTGYSLSAGGPVLPPLSRDMLLTPVAPHLSRMRPFVLPSESTLQIEVQTDLTAIVSVDGQFDIPIAGGGIVTCRISERQARFTRLEPPSAFFHKLAQHLNLSTRRGDP